MKVRQGVKDALAAWAKAVRRIISPLGSAAAFSWAVAATYCPVLVLIQLGNASIFGGSRLLWILASSFGAVALVAVFGAARSRVPADSGPGPGTVLVWYSVAAITQGMTFGFASVLLGAADSPHLDFRLSGILIQLPLLIAVGYAVARHDAHRRIITELEQTRERLVVVKRRLDTETNRIEADLASAARETLEPAVSSLDIALADAEAGGNRAEVIEALDELVEKRVRPLSHKLLLATDAHEQTRAKQVPLAKVPLPARFRLRDAIQPFLATLLLWVAAIPSAVRVLETGDLLLYLVTFSLLAWTLLSLARLAAGSRQVRTLPGLPGVVLLYALAGWAAFWLIGELGVDRPPGIGSSVGPFFALLGLAITVSLIVQARRTSSENARLDETHSLERATEFARRRERLARRRLAFVIHGSLQGALHAAALRVAEAEVITPQLGADIRGDIVASLSAIGNQPLSGGLLQTLVTTNELSSVWEGRRRLSVRLGPAVEETLHGDTDVDAAVAEVVRESVNNAFRHGAARNVEVEVTKTGGDLAHESEIAISVKDDGVGCLETDRPGLGSVLFDDLCRSWVLEPSDRGTVFRARVGLRLPEAAF